VDKKVTMISPLVQKYYSPWINSAQILHGTLQRLTTKHPAEQEDIQTLLYHIMVFYGYRMKFVLEAGGLILLSSTAEQNAVHDAYRTAELALDWGGGQDAQRGLVSPDALPDQEHMERDRGCTERRAEADRCGG
jgi:hypothetical protein